MQSYFDRVHLIGHIQITEMAEELRLIISMIQENTELTNRPPLIMNERGVYSDKE